MFTFQVGQLDQLAPWLPPEAIEILRNTFGQCEQLLQHRGPVQVEMGHHLTAATPAHTPYRPPVGEKPVAGMAVENRASTYSPASGMVSGGYAFHGIGVSYFDTIVAGRLVTDKINIPDPDDPGPGTGGDDDDDDGDGPGPGPGPGDDDDDGTVLFGSRPVLVTALYNWQYDDDLPSRGGSGWVVAVVQGKEAEGQVRVWLPVARGQDPNVVAGMTLVAWKMATGDYVAPGYADDAVRTIKMTTADNARIPTGWRLLPGPLTNDGAFVRGTGLDSGFPVGDLAKMDPSPRPAGDVSGSPMHKVPGVDVNLIASRLADHPMRETSAESANITIAPHSGTTNSAVTGIRVHPPPPHTHPTYSYHVRGCTPEGGGGGGYPGYDDYDPQYGGACMSITTSYGPSNGGGGDLTVEEPNAGVGTGHSHAFGPLNHQVQGGVHAHATPPLKHQGIGKMEDVEVPLMPLAVSLKFIERVDNSRIG